MGFAYADAADQEQAGMVERKLLHKFAGRHPRRRKVAMRPVEFKIRQFAMLIALGNSGEGKQCLSPRLPPALASGHAPFRSGQLPSRSPTNDANFGSNLHHPLSIPLCTGSAGSRKSSERGSCAEAVQGEIRLWTTRRNWAIDECPDLGVFRLRRI